MADNTTITPGSGATIGADDVGGVLIQRVKPTWGPDGTATDVDAGTGMPIQSGWKEYSGSAAANNADLVSVDVSGYRWVSLQTTGTSNATLSFQQSNDGTNWHSLILAITSNSSPGLGASTFTSVPSTWSGGISSRYVRFRTTSYTSGTVTILVELTTLPSALPYVGVSSNGSNLLTQIVAASISSDALTTSGVSASPNFQYNGTNWDRQRVPTIFKSVTATASGNTAVWTPGASKKFRLMRYKIDVTQDAAQTTGGDITIGLQDNTTDIGLSQSLFVPATAATTMGPGWTSGWIDIGNGKLSSTINQVLNVNLSAALTSGTARVVVCGVEE